MTPRCPETRTTLLQTDHWTYKQSSMPTRQDLGSILSESGWVCARQSLSSFGRNSRASAMEAAGFDERGLMDADQVPSNRRQPETFVHDPIWRIDVRCESGQVLPST